MEGTAEMTASSPGPEAGELRRGCSPSRSSCFAVATPPAPTTTATAMSGPRTPSACSAPWWRPGPMPMPRPETNIKCWNGSLVKAPRSCIAAKRPSASRSPSSSRSMTLPSEGTRPVITSPCSQQ